VAVELGGFDQAHQNGSVLARRVAMNYVAKNRTWTPPVCQVLNS
jgi:hypothetical protein